VRTADEPIPVGEPIHRRRRQAAAIVVFGTWMIVGLFLDGWSHIHHRPETFFTPWHGVLYSGFLAGALWFAIDQRGRRAEPGLVGGRVTVVGLAIFSAAAVGDFLWHTLFGIERNVAALLSPTHLLLMLGGAMMVTAPVRDAWVEPSPQTTRRREFWPVVGSLTLTVALLLFFLQYLSPFRSDIVAQPVVNSFRFVSETDEVRTIGSVLVTTVVLIGALLFVLRRWEPPPGTFTVLFTVPALAMSGLDGFHRLPLALCAVAGGLVADILVEADVQPRWLAAAVPVGVWLPCFVVFKVAYDLPWTVHLWLGTVFLAAFTGVGLSLLANPPPLPSQE
jgi:ABC-type tungstate transport system substrate-binding protein